MASTWVPGIILFAVSAGAMGITSGFEDAGVLPWQILMVTILFTTVFYEVVGLFRPRWGRYTAISYAVFILLLIGLYFIAAGIATTPMRDLPRFQKFIGLLIIFKVLLTGLAGLYRVALNFLGHDQAR